MSEPIPSQHPAPAAPRTRALSENPRLAALAASLLPTSNAFVQLSDEETRCVVAYLREVSYSRGERLFTAGDVSNSSYLLLLLEGEVSVDTGDAGGGVAISVLGPGAVLGEMAMLDGAPRSATCSALSDIHAAGLARKGLEQMIEGHPKVAAKLMVALCQRLSDRLRALGEQLQLYAQVSR
jgi:CRP-like cAMP-binding protein